jgi:Flp pilus assembly protein TadD
MNRSFTLGAALLLAQAGCLALAPVPAASQDFASQGSTRSLYLELIRQARSDQRPRAALAFLDDFDSNYPNDVEAMVLRINCLLDLGNVDQAAGIADRLPDNRRASDLGAAAARGHVLTAQERWPEAVVRYRAAIEASPADAFLRNALGYAQLRAGHPAEAIENLRGANELAPNSSVIRNNLMLALVLNGDAESAFRLLDAASSDRARTQVQEAVLTEASRISRSVAQADSQTPGGEEI